VRASLLELLACGLLGLGSDRAGALPVDRPLPLGEVMNVEAWPQCPVSRPVVSAAALCRPGRRARACARAA
jgi:hypothetical protein